MGLNIESALTLLIFRLAWMRLTRVQVNDEVLQVRIHTILNWIEPYRCGHLIFIKNYPTLSRDMRIITL